MYNGEDIKKQGKQYRASLGYAPQQQWLYDDFRVTEYLHYMASLKNVPRREQRTRIDELLEQMNLEYARHQKIKTLSGGMKQRLLIAQALLNDPEVLLLDEPTAGLDPKGRDDILGQIAKLQKERGITIVLVSHSMEDVAQYASRILVVNGGKIVFDDKPRKVFEHEKELNEMGLAIPQVTQLMHRLKSEGYPVFENAITVQEARKNLLIYFQGKKKQDCKSKDQNNQDQKSQIESRRKPEGKTV